MDTMDTTGPSPPLPDAAALRHKVYVDENGLETTLLESRKRTGLSPLPDNKRTRSITTSPVSVSLSSPVSMVDEAEFDVGSPKDVFPEVEQWVDQYMTFSSEHKATALFHLTLRCETKHLTQLKDNIERQFKRDFISMLPKEVALHILSYLEPRDIVRASQTSRRWHMLCEDSILWKEKCQEEEIEERSVKAYNANPWKHLYLTKRRIEFNWREGRLRPEKVLRGHDEHVVTCLKFHGNRIVSGSDDSTLKVWHATTGKCLQTLVGHTGGVWCSEFDGEAIVSGSTDRTLRVWNADTGQCVHVLHGHTSTVRCMAMHDKKVVSGSRDASLHIWDIKTGLLCGVLSGHVAAVRCVQFDGRRVVSGAYDYLVKVWDPETRTCLHTLQGHTNRVYSLQFDGTHIVSGSLDTYIRVWDAETGQCVHTLSGHRSLTSGMELRKNVLVSGNADSTVRVWNIVSGQCLHKLEGPHCHESAVTSLQFTDRFIVTSSDDGTVKLWDLQTGKFLRNLVELPSGGNGGVVWRVKCTDKKLVCAVGSRNGVEDTKLLVLDFDVQS